MGFIMKVVIAVCARWLCPYSDLRQSMIFEVPDDITKLKCIYDHEMIFNEL